jgi:hypothetical protein
MGGTVCDESALLKKQGLFMALAILDHQVSIVEDVFEHHKKTLPSQVDLGDLPLFWEDTRVLNSVSSSERTLVDSI